MPDAAALVGAIKKAAQQAGEAGKPVNVEFGTVISVSPLKVQVDQKMPLGEQQMVLSRNVTNYATTCTVNWTTSDGASVSGTKAITINNALVAGDRVILIRQQEGQKYLIFDRVG